MQEAALGKNNFVKNVLKMDEVGVFIPLAIIIIITGIFRPSFLAANNFASMFTQIPFIALTALGAGFPLMVGHVDISTGKVAGFAGIIMSSLVVSQEMNIWLAMLIALAAALVVGLINGILVVKIKIPDFVATMGTLYIVGGLRYLFIQGYQFSLNTPSCMGLVSAFDRRYLGMPLHFWIMLIIFAVTYVIIKRTIWGRQLLATGDNKEVAILAGIKVERMKMYAYLLSALFAAIAGILITLDVGIGLPETGDGWEFRAIAGCVVGGVSLSGGKGSPIGILIGITLIFVAENAIIFLGCPGTMKTAVQGFLMAVAVLFDVYRQKKKIPA